MRAAVALVGILALAACTLGQPEPAISRVTCGGPAFDVALVEPAEASALPDHPATAALRDLTRERNEDEPLPEDGWIEVTRSDTVVQYVAREGDGQIWAVAVELKDGRWVADRWGPCTPQPEISADVNLAMFRVAAGEEVAAHTTEVHVLVTEMACNSGQDASGRILEPKIIEGVDSVIVVMTVRPREGSQQCPGNPETPFLLVLPEPLGDRALLDGSEVPARDATVCPERLCP